MEMEIGIDESRFYKERPNRCTVKTRFCGNCRYLVAEWSTCVCGGETLCYRGRYRCWDETNDSGHVHTAGQCDPPPAKRES